MKNKHLHLSLFHPAQKVHKKVNAILAPEIFVLPFLLLNILLFGACMIVTNRIEESNFIKRMSIQKSVTLPLVTSAPNEIMARSYILYNPRTRMIVTGKNEKLKFAPASTTKIMTALVSLDYYSPDDVLIARNMSAVEGSKMNLIEGEAMTVRNLLYGMMLPSGNDAATVLAQNYPGGKPAFVEAMNQKAKQLHMDDTVFIDPAGLDDHNSSTAYDLARLGHAALQNELLSQVIKTRETVVYNTASTSAYPLKNLNELLYDPNVIGIKTGFTDEAGGVLVTAYKIKGETYVTVVMKTDNRFYDTQQILYGIIPTVKETTFSIQ